MYIIIITTRARERSLIFIPLFPVSFFVCMIRSVYTYYYKMGMFISKSLIVLRLFCEFSFWAVEKKGLLLISLVRGGGEAILLCSVVVVRKREELTREREKLQREIPRTSLISQYNIYTLCTYLHTYYIEPFLVEHSFLTILFFHTCINNHICMFTSIRPLALRLLHSLSLTINISQLYQYTYIFTRPPPLHSSISNNCTNLHNIFSIIISLHAFLAWKPFPQQSSSKGNFFLLHKAATALILQLQHDILWTFSKKKYFSDLSI